MSPHTDRGGEARGGTRSVRTLRDRWWLILVGVLVMGGVGFGISYLLEPRYGATAQVTYSQRDADAVTKALTDAGTAGLPKTISSDALILQTSSFADRVARALGGVITPSALSSRLEVSVVTEVELVEIECWASRAGLAADIANTAAEEFIEIRQEELSSLLQSALDFVQGRIDSLTPLERSGSTAAALEQQRYALSSLLTSSISDYKMLEKAAPPPSPYFPKPLLNMLVGLAAGLVLGVILALLANVLDRRIRDRATLERVLDLPVLGTMAAAPGRRGNRRHVAGFKKGSESLLESMRTLRSNLKVLGFGDNIRTMLITSTAEAEGRSALAAHLTLSMALAGDRVILVDADLREPSIHDYLDIPNLQGLADVLIEGINTWSDKIQPIEVAPYIDERLMSSHEEHGGRPAVTKFMCLTGGAPPADPIGVLESGAMSLLLTELQGYSDYVIIDGPPTLTVSDSLILARSVDAVVVASTLGKQTVAEARQVRRLLARAEIEPLGVILCGVPGQGRSSRHARPGHEHDTASDGG